MAKQSKGFRLDKTTQHEIDLIKTATNAGSETEVIETAVKEYCARIIRGDYLHFRIAEVQAELEELKGMLPV